jgi:hypothetical protein
MYTNNELLFPHHVIPALRKLRGQQWRTLVEQVMKLPENHEESLAFMLMMIRLNGCMACETDSYRAMRGCSACAIQTLRRYKGEDDELVDMFRQALADVRKFSEHNPAVGVTRTASSIERRGEGFQPPAF